MPQQLGRTLQVPDEIRLRSNFYSGYIQDRWDISRRFTITYGIRWEYLPLPTRDDRGVEFYNSPTNQILICGYGQVPGDCGVSMSKTGFVPRVGIVYRARNTLIIRAGYGIPRDPYDIGPRGVRTNS
jgi:outer membrane receptor protein involved in Fe transport